MQKFPLGRVVATPGALAELARLDINPLLLIGRHVSGDDGDLDAEDKATNVLALQTGARIFSSYLVGDVKLWVITEADRSSTCVLLPEEY